MAKISPVVWWAVNFVQGDTRGTCMPMGLMLLPENRNNWAWHWDVRNCPFGLGGENTLRRFSFSPHLRQQSLLGEATLTSLCDAQLFRVLR